MTVAAAVTSAAAVTLGAAGVPLVADPRDGTAVVAGAVSTAVVADPRDGTAVVAGGGVSNIALLVLDQAGFPVTDEAGHGIS